MRLAGGQELDNQRLPRLDVHPDLLAGAKAVKERRGRQHADVGVGLPEFVVLEKNLGIEQEAQHFVAAHGSAGFLLQRPLGGVEIHGLEVRPGA